MDYLSINIDLVSITIAFVSFRFLFPYKEYRNVYYETILNLQEGYKKKKAPNKKTDRYFKDIFMRYGFVVLSYSYLILLSLFTTKKCLDKYSEKKDTEGKIFKKRSDKLIKYSCAFIVLSQIILIVSLICNICNMKEKRKGTTNKDNDQIIKQGKQLKPQNLYKHLLETR